MMTEERLMLREQISALADGQLEGERFAAVVGKVGGDEEARDSWQVYHLIGDVLRSGESGACLHDRAFVARLRTRIEAETVAPRMSVPALDAPERIAENGLSVLGKSQESNDFRHAANDGAYRWKMLAGLATVVAAAALGWSGLGGHARETQLAQGTVSSPATVASASGSGVAVMLRDPHLDALMAAHRQFGGPSALQNSSGFLRNATFDMPLSRGSGQ